MVEHFLSQTDGRWLYTKAGGLDEAIALPSLNCRLALADVYRKVA